MKSILRKMVLSTAVMVAANGSAFADAGHASGHEAFVSKKSKTHTHATQTGKVRTGNNTIEIYDKLHLSVGVRDRDPGADDPRTMELSSHDSLETGNVRTSDNASEIHNNGEGNK